MRLPSIWTLCNQFADVLEMVLKPHISHDWDKALTAAEQALVDAEAERDTLEPGFLSWGVDGATTAQCLGCGGAFPNGHKCLRDKPKMCVCGHGGDMHQRVGGIIDPCLVRDCDCNDMLYTDSPAASAGGVPPTSPAPGEGPSAVCGSPQPPAEGLPNETLSDLAARWRYRADQIYRSNPTAAYHLRFVADEVRALDRTRAAEEAEQ